MPVTITPASAAGLPSEVWTFDAPEPPVHPVLGDVSVDGAAVATASRLVSNDLAKVAVIVTCGRQWGPKADRYSAAGQRAFLRVQAELAVFGATADVMQRIWDQEAAQ